jgi:hypothetical protein
MVRKTYSPEQIINKLREAEIHIHQGIPIAEARRKFSVTEQSQIEAGFSNLTLLNLTLYHWLVIKVYMLLSLCSLLYNINLSQEVTYMR